MFNPTRLAQSVCRRLAVYSHAGYTDVLVNLYEPGLTRVVGAMLCLTLIASNKGF